MLGDRPATRPSHVIDTTTNSTSESLGQEDSIGNDTSDISADTPQDDIDCPEDESIGDTSEEPHAAGQRREASRDTPTTSSKRSRKSGVEKALFSLTETFLTQQRDMEKRMIDAEEKRQRLEMEQMERMRKEDREHELRLFQMLGQIIGSGVSQPPPPHQSHYFGPPPQLPPTLAMPYAQLPQMSPPSDPACSENNSSYSNE